MTTAKNAFSFTLENFPNITASVLEWPLTTIRLQSDEIEPLIQAADHILKHGKIILTRTRISEPLGMIHHIIQSHRLPECVLTSMNSISSYAITEQLKNIH